MNVSAIISEYNPLHSGHVYHINQTKKLTNCDGLICVMSGNFVQRGLPAFIDKWNRTKMALLNGVDLVIELPSIYSLSSAEFFAHGSVSLLNSLNIVRSLCFGSECGDISILKDIAYTLCKEPIEYRNLLKVFLNQGLPYTKARSNALISYFQNKNYTNINHMSEILSSSNNILGIEYCKSLINNNSNINPLTIKREGSKYNDETLSTTFSSATSIRKFLKDNNNIKELESHMPYKSFNVLKDLYINSYKFPNEDDILPFIQYRSLTEGNALKNIPDASEGLDNKIFNEIQKYTNLEELILSIKSKRYTFTRISRILCQYFIGFDRYNIDLLRRSTPNYIRILGFNDTGIKILREIKEKSEMSLFTKIPKNRNQLLDLDIQATNAYSLINKSICFNQDFLNKPIIIKSND